MADQSPSAASAASAPASASPPSLPASVPVETPEQPGTVPWPSKIFAALAANVAASHTLSAQLPGFLSVEQ